MELAHRAIGGDHELERPVAPAAIVDQPATITVERAAGDRDAGVDRRGVAGGGEQRLEQHAAVDAEAGEPRIDLRVFEVDEEPSAAAHAAQPVDPRTVVADRGEQAEPGEHGLPGRLQRDARADRPGLGHALEHGDGVARPREQDRRRGARGPGADDPDHVGWHAGGALPITGMNW